MQEFIPVNLHYYNRYIRFIKHYQENQIDTSKYFEKHHIVPKSMGGSNDKSNLVNLSARAHFIAHFLLWKAYRNKETAYAFNCMSRIKISKNYKNRRYFNSRLYEKFTLKAKHFFCNKNHPSFGKEKNPESIQKQRLKMLGRKQSDDHVKNRVNSFKKFKEQNPDYKGAFYGKKHTDEYKLKMRNLFLGKRKSKQHVEKMKSRPQNNLNTKCPHCNKVGEFKNMKRWHFDFCKKNINKKEKEIEMITCSKCGYTNKKTPNFYKYHENNCNQSQNSQ